MSDLPPRERPSDRHLWEIAAVRDLFWLVVAVALLWLGYDLRSIFTPVLIALLLAYLFDPLITTAERRAHLSRPLTVALILIGIGLAGAAFAVWLAPVLVDQLVGLVKKIASASEDFARRHNFDVERLKQEIEALRARTNKDPLALAQNVFAGTSRAFGVLGGVIGTTTYVLATLLVIPIYFFFFAWRFHGMDAVMRWVPASRRDRTRDVLRRMDSAVGGFFRSRLIISGITGVLFALGWWAAGVPYWFVLGIVTGLLNFVPVAAVVGWPSAILLKHLDVVATSPDGAYPWVAVFVWPSVVYLVVQLMDGWILTPWIQGKSTDLGPVTILIVLVVGGAIAGLYGLILAIPVAACVKILFHEVLLPRVEAWAQNR
jgi:predicted PurR-regulated permease PerM